MTIRQRIQLASPTRVAPVLMLAAVGCSLIVPLDEYVGGAGGASSGGSAGLAPVGGSGGASGQTALGGTSGDASGATGGTGAKGGSGGSEGGNDNGGSPDAGGMAGEENGGDGPTSGRGGTLGGAAGSAGGGAAGTTAGMGGTAGTSGTAGMGGTTAGMGGRGGRGGRGGMSGTGGLAGSSGCGNVDLTTDHEHCGSCEHACESNEQCLDSYCASSPCDGICATFSSVTLSPGMGYKRDNIGTGEVCAEVTGYDVSPEPPSLVCWNFNEPTVLELNGTEINCNGVGQEFDVPLRLGGYCVHAAPGMTQYRGFEFPD